MASIRQKKLAKVLLENKGKPVSEAMLEVGYPPTTAKNPQQVTESKGFKELMEELLPDKRLTQAHEELLEQKRVDYFVFSKSLKDDEIIAHVKAAGFDVITVRESEKGKMAFYSVPDTQAKKSALDMAYKLKGNYAPEKSMNINVDIEGDPQTSLQFDEWRKQQLKEAGER